MQSTTQDRNHHAKIYQLCKWLDGFDKMYQQVFGGGKLALMMINLYIIMATLEYTV